MASTHRPSSEAWNLRTAYKQLPLSDASFELDSYSTAAKVEQNLSATCFALRIYSQRCELHQAAYALWRLGTLGLDPVWSKYFDDYLSVCGRKFARHCDFVIALFFQILGWEVSKDKKLSYESMCTVLGVRINLKDAKLGLCFLGNTDKRRAEAMIRSLLL